MNALRRVKNGIEYYLFFVNGMKPWSTGYLPYKKKQILDSIDLGKFNGGKLGDAYGFRVDERVVEYPWLFSRLPPSRGRLLDAGSVLNLEHILCQDLLKEKQIFISTLAPEPACYWNYGISYVYEDLRETCYRDNYFDWVVSLSTIEHIGLDNTLLYTSDTTKNENDPDSHLLAVKEFNRILKPGGTLYLSFPYGKPQNYGWFQVFDAAMVDRVVEAFDPEFLVDLYFEYKVSGWEPASRETARNATCFDFNANKSYDEDFAAASRAVVCLEMRKRSA